MTELSERLGSHLFDWEPAKTQWDLVKEQRNWVATPYDEITVNDEISVTVDPIREWKRNFPSAVNEYIHSDTKAITVDVVLGLRLTYAAYLLNEVVEIDPQKVGGAPVLTGTRFKVAQILAELADGKSVSSLARTFRLDKKKVAALLHGMAIYLDRSFIR